MPVLVVEKVGPIEAIRRSGGLLRRTWGEQVVGNISFGLVTFLLFLLAALLLALPAGLIISILGPALGVLLAFLLYILVLGAFLMISNALSGIYQAALYLYATERGMCRTSIATTWKALSAPRSDPTSTRSARSSPKTAAGRA